MMKAISAHEQGFTVLAERKPPQGVGVPTPAVRRVSSGFIPGISGFSESDSEALKD
jgi:hypothetical protein